MASTTKTENYQLNQYGANDQPTWVGDYSGDMLKIDTALGNATKRMSDKFSETETYAVGDLCIKDDLLYKFTAAKEAGAWDEEKVKATTVKAEFKQLYGDIIGIKNQKLTASIVVLSQTDKAHTLQFSGNIQGRTAAALLLLTSQSSMVTPIAVMFAGNTGETNIQKMTPYVSSGLNGITCGTKNGRITIPTYGNLWGTYTVLLLRDTVSVSLVD